MSQPIDPKDKSMDELVALAKRCGFVYPASDIYGGINGFWDYGPLGVALKNNIRDSWWKAMVDCPPIGPDGEPVSIVGLDSAIIQNPTTWEMSGHAGGFSDPMVDCKETNSRYRADQLYVLKPKYDDIDHPEFHIALEVETSDQAKDVWEQHGHAYLKRVCKHFKLDPRKFTDKGYYLGGDPFEKVASDVNELAKTFGPAANDPGTLTEPREFNLMLAAEIGAVNPVKAYLRPETAQGIFLNYKNVLDTMRVKVPFGIAQIGKSFRNEVTPRNFIFRSREFEQMEMEWFCPPEDSMKWYAFWKEERMKWWESLGVNPDNLIFRDHDEDELAHYSKACVDVEYKYPFTAPDYGELEGVAHRGDFDLTAHSKGLPNPSTGEVNRKSNAKMEYFDQAAQLAAKAEGLSKEEIDAKSKYIPHVIEPASGLTRAVLVLLCEAFTPTPDRKGSKYTMMFKPSMAPIKAAIFPLVNKDGMPEKARQLYDQLRQKYPVQYDAKQSIGKRYARMDEAGTPFCFTIDGDSLTDNTVTVRDRDTAEQSRMPIDEVQAFLDAKINA